MTDNCVKMEIKFGLCYVVFFLVLFQRVFILISLIFNLLTDFSISREKVSFNLFFSSLSFILLFNTCNVTSYQDS